MFSSVLSKKAYFFLLAVLFLSFQARKDQLCLRSATIQTDGFCFIGLKMRVFYGIIFKIKFSTQRGERNVLS